MVVSRTVADPAKIVVHQYTVTLNDNQMKQLEDTMKSHSAHMLKTEMDRFRDHMLTLHEEFRVKLTADMIDVLVHNVEFKDVTELSKQ
jgi:hypothetical protein